MSTVTAKDIMSSSPLITVTPDASLQEIARVLTDYRISGVPVVTDEGKLVGIVSEADLLPKEAGNHLRTIFVWSEKAKRLLRKFEGTTARELMTAEVITAHEATPVKSLASMMIANQINRVPIVRGDKPVGIVSRNDVLKVFSRSDKTLEGEIKSQVAKDLGTVEHGLAITVHEGVVSMSGRIALRTEADLIASFVRTIDGVVAVDTKNLTFEYDDVITRMPIGF